MTDEQEQVLRDYVQSLGLSYEATFQPRPQPVETVKTPQLHWLITLTSQGKFRHTMQTDYNAGVGHVANYKQHGRQTHDARQWEKAYRMTCENGRLYKVESSQGSIDPLNKWQPKPDLLDVLYGLVSDADVLDHTSFESWAEAYDFDTDSRKAEDIYRVCLKNAHGLMPIIGGPKGLAKLQELFQDY